MYIAKVEAIMIAAGLALAILGGCGSGANDTNSTQAGENTFKVDDNGTDNIPTVGYVAGNGVLFETKSDGSKLVWVNTSSDSVCKISRPEDSDRTDKNVYAVAKEHCENLNYAEITTWRLPTVSESMKLMDRNNSEFLLFPDSNKNCQYMTTTIENTFVFTTSTFNSVDKIGTSFIDEIRNDKTAGIRCVADQ